MDISRAPEVQPSPAPTPKIAQAPAVDPSIYDLDAAIQPWTVLVNQAMPDVYNTLNYLRGIIDRL